MSRTRQDHNDEFATKQNRFAQRACAAAISAMAKPGDSKDSNEEKKSKKPSGAAWKQQKLSACKPVWSGKLVAIVFGVMGVIHLVIGIPIYISVDNVCLVFVHLLYVLCLSLPVSLIMGLHF
jgi:hypothetical protein